MRTFSPKSQTSAHLAALDGLRGIAIALVVWYHVWQITWLRADAHVGATTLNFNEIPEAGFIGVDLFFFISGFVLFYPYSRALFDGCPRPTAREFFARRALKILPSYYLSIAVVIGLGWVHFTSLGDALAQIASHLLFIHVLWNETYGGINGVLWSLAVEVQFYAIFPIVAWCAMRRALPTFVTLGALGIGYRLLVVHDFDATYQIQQLPGTIDLFAAGMACAYVFRAIATRAPRIAQRRTFWTIVAAIGIAASALALRGAYDTRLLPNWPNAWYVFGRTELGLSFACVSLGSLFAYPVWQRALANPIFTFLAFVSYNLYLYHQIIARALFAARVPEWMGPDPHSDGRWGLVFTVVAFALSLAVAWILTVTVERGIYRGLGIRVPRTPARGEHVATDPA